jgi:hypothetical protein
LGAPINAFSLWNDDQFSILQGADELVGFSKTAHTIRKRCAKCGCAVLSEHPDRGFVDVFASFLEGFEHNPVCHVFYGERMIDMRDGLPKHRGRPGADRTVGDMPE